MFKQLITSSYGDEIYRKTLKLQNVSKKSALSKNQWTFLDRCIYHRIIPKSFRNKPTLRTQKGYNITHQYNLSMMVATRNFVKQKYYQLTRTAAAVRDDMKSILQQNDFDILARITEQGRENVFLKERDRLKTKFEQLSGKRSRSFSHQRTRTDESVSLLKPAVLNLTEEDVQPGMMELLDLGPKFVPSPDSIPFMDIITSTECVAIDLARESEQSKAESMRKDI